MPFLWANAHRKEGSPEIPAESFMPTVDPPEVDEEAEALRFFRALDRQIAIGDARQAALKLNGQT